MKLMQCLGAVCAVLCLAVLATAEDAKFDAKKLVGKWVAGEGGGVPAGMVVVVTKDGKVNATAEVDGTKHEAKGTYTLKGDSLTAKVTVDGEEKTHSLKITTLTADKLVVENSEGKVTTFKRKK